MEILRLVTCNNYIWHNSLTNSLILMMIIILQQNVPKGNSYVMFYFVLWIDILRHKNSSSMKFYHFYRSLKEDSPKYSFETENALYSLQNNVNHKKENKCRCFSTVGIIGTTVAIMSILTIVSKYWMFRLRHKKFLEIETQYWLQGL